MTAITHVGLSLPDLDQAVAWYSDVLGFEPLGAPTTVRAHKGHAGTVAADVLGADFGSFRQAHLTGGNGVALELFQFERAARWTGIFHVCVTTPDVRRTANRIAASGGRRSSRVWDIFAGEPFLLCYCEDPSATRWSCTRTATSGPMRTARRAALAVVGLGRIGRLHADNLASRVGSARLVAVADVLEPLASGAGERHGVRWSTSLEDVLAESAPRRRCDRRPERAPPRARGRGRGRGQARLLREAARARPRGVRSGGRGRACRRRRASGRLPAPLRQRLAGD